MKICPTCNTKIKNKTKYCPECGTSIPYNKNDDNCKATSLYYKILICFLCLLLIISLIIITLLISKDYNKENIAVESGNSTEQTNSFSNDPTKIADTAKSVVKINCYDAEDTLIAVGSGFSAFEEGVIITNYHVIEDYPERIEIVTETGEKCDIFGGIGVSKERDIAILYYQHQNSNINIPVLPINTSDELQKGEKVIAIGSPLGLTNVVSSGVFSGYTNTNGVTDIQFTASISSGSSGGALFNDSGEVIGITYGSIESGQNLNFAVPIDFVISLWKSESLNKSQLSSFFDTITPHYTIDFVLANYIDLQDTIFYLDYNKATYEDTGNEIIVYFEDNNSQIITGICFSNDYWTKCVIQYNIDNSEEIKCIGVFLLENDTTPYLIINP